MSAVAAGSGTDAQFGITMKHLDREADTPAPVKRYSVYYGCSLGFECPRTIVLVVLRPEGASLVEARIVEFKDDDRGREGGAFGD